MASTTLSLRMKRSSWMWVVVLNLLALVAFYYIQQNIATREAYWLRPDECIPNNGLPCYQPSISRTFLFYVLSADCTQPAECGTTHVPGTLTFDWLQLALLIAAVTDILTVWSYVRGQKSPES